MRVPINIHLETGGEFRLITRNRDLYPCEDTGWFHNLVLDGGLIQMTTQGSWANNFHIGDSAIPPSDTQTALLGWLGVDDANLADINVNLGANDYQGQTTRTRRFNAGTATGTIREIGVNHLSSNTLMSIRALVTPEIGKADEQILDASYRLTTWPNLLDATGITNIFGDDYDYTVRMGNVQLLGRVFEAYVPESQIAGHKAYDGDIGPITGVPSGDDSNSSSVVITGQGSGFCNYTVNFGIDSGNVAGGIRSIASQLFGAIGSTNPSIQVEFRNRGEGAGALDSTIPKNDTREISFDLGITWDRH